MSYTIKEYPLVEGTRTLFSKVIGCEKYNKDVMLEVTTAVDGNTEVLCIFLSNIQTEQLVEKLQTTLSHNRIGLTEEIAELKEELKNLKESE